MLSGLVVAALAGGALLATPGSAGVADTPQVFRFHGGGYDQASAIAVDDAGNAYVAGSVSPDGRGVFAVVKLSPSGTPLWTARYNGSLGGVGGNALAVALDSAGNVYAAGWTGDGVTFNDNIDYLVVGFGPDGRQRWAQRHDGPGRNFDRATEIVVDSSGVYVSGFQYGPSPGLNYDWTTYKYSSAGTLLWERRHGGADDADDRPADMALAPNGNLVITGFARNTGDGQTNDAETVTYDPAGNVVWQRRWTDTAASHETPMDLAVDGAGRIVITGTTAESPSPYAVPLPVTLRYDSAGTLLQTIRDGGNSVDTDSAGRFVLARFLTDIDGNHSAAVSRYDASGARAWSTPLTLGSEDVLATAFARFDPSGAVTVAGTARNVFIHNDDYLTIRYASDGRELWRFPFNGPVGGDDRVAGLAIDGAGNALVTGTSWNGYLSYKGTADDIVTLRFASGAAPALEAPSGLTATGISRSQLRLAWTDNAGTEDGFRIERCQGNGCTSFALIATVGHDVTAYTDSGLARNTQYTYRVQAFNANGVSGYSNTATGKTRRN